MGTDDLAYVLRLHPENRTVFKSCQKKMQTRLSHRSDHKRCPIIYMFSKGLGFDTVDETNSLLLGGSDSLEGQLSDR